MRPYTSGRSSRIRTGVLSAVLFIIVAAISTSPLARDLALNLSDGFFRIAPEPKEPSSIVLVLIDDDSLRTYGRWPWSRTLLAKLTRNLKQAGARVVGLDILLSEPQTPEADLSLSRAISDSNVVIVDKIGAYPDGPRWIEPLPEFSRTAAVGHAQAVLDVDGVCRRYPLRELTADGSRFAFAVEVARRVDPQKTEQFLTANGAGPIDNGPVLVMKPRLITIPYRRGGFDTISASKVLQGRNLEKVQGRSVLVGFGPTEISDRISTPLMGELPTPGVEVHAQILDAILSGRRIHESPFWLSSFMLLVTCIFITACLGRWHGWKAIAEMALAGASIYAVALAGFAYLSWSFPVSALLLAFFLGPLVAYVVDFILIERSVTRALHELQGWLSSHGQEVPSQGDLSWRLDLLRNLQAELGSLYELHATLMETTQDSVAIFDWDGRLLLHNQRFATLFLSSACPPTLDEFLSTLWSEVAEPPVRNAWGKEGEVIVASERHTARVATLPATSLTPGGGTVVTLASLKVREERDLARAEALGFVTHELRAPLVAIQGFAEVMIQYPDSPTCEKAPDTIFRESKRLLALISSYLDVLRLDAGARPIVRERVELGDIVRDVFELLDPLATAAAIRLKHESESAISMDGDRSLLAGAVLNLVSNAIKYGSMGSSVTVRCSRYGGAVAISVHNEGDPIAREDISRVFDSYYRGSKMQLGRTGWGLGLAFVKRIAEKHGGTARVESGIDGTTFEIRLPAEQNVTAARGAA